MATVFIDRIKLGKRKRNHFIEFRFENRCLKRCSFHRCLCPCPCMQCVSCKLLLLFMNVEKKKKRKTKSPEDHFKCCFSINVLMLRLTDFWLHSYWVTITLVGYCHNCNFYLKINRLGCGWNEFRNGYSISIKMSFVYSAILVNWKCSLITCIYWRQRRRLRQHH